MANKTIAQPSEKMLKAMGLTEWPPVPMATKVKRLQTENAQLKEQLADLSEYVDALSEMALGGAEND